MSHTIYTTDAIVLHRVSTSEADATLWLLTAELGLVVARAQGARKSTAKMRGYLQLFSVLRISMVRGKHTWRVTGAESVQGAPLDTLALQGEALSIFARISAFVRRMILTDTQSALELFEIVLSARVALAAGQDPQVVELTTLAKVLISLGYIESATLSKMEHNQITQRELTHIVNSAIVESHL